ncbi:MAG: MotA/TolQ/ExbB proton channel family protein [Pasteurellaceae bacterium]|nr:MotA/TolQ/ExbB proton channel family protein [Pasteurellaceae bacterium]
MFSDPVIFSFSTIIFSVFSLVLFSLFIKGNLISLLGERIAYSAPTLLTSIGILGTFVGIIYALLDFDTTNLDSSIPQLLDGMKVAFLTSVIGMTASILLKIIMLILGKEDDNQENIFFTEQVKVQTKSLEKIVNLTEQQQTYLKDFEHNLFDELNNFTQNLSEQTTQHIIDALEGVVVNFNESLVNQFGDNFVKFEQSIDALLEWQENYKELLTKKMDKYDLNARVLREVKESILEIESSIARIPSLVDDFAQVIAFNQKQIGKIGDQMSIFADLKDKALETFPEIEQYFNRMADNIEDSTSKFNHLLQKHSVQTANHLSDLSNKMAGDFMKNAMVISDYNQDTMNGLLSSTEKLNDFVRSLDKILLNQFNQMNKQFIQSVETLISDQSSQFKKVIDDLEKKNEKLLKDFSDRQEEKNKSSFSSIINIFGRKEK